MNESNEVTSKQDNGGGRINEQGKWKDVKDYEGFYQVSSRGEVKSLQRMVKSKHGLRNKKEQIIKPVNRLGYHVVMLRKLGTKKIVFIHRLVAEAFLSKPEGKNIVVNHKSGIKTDNSIKNLEWTTQSENVRHAYALGLAKACGHNKKLDDCQVLTILTMPSVSQEKFAKLYNVSQSVVKLIRLGHTYKNITKDILC